MTCSYIYIFERINMTKNYILLKQVGKFINVYNEDAYIISYLLNYKIINNKVGFPLSSLNKVINILDTNTINYKINDTYKNYKNKNKYTKALNYSKSIIHTRNRFTSLEDSLKGLSIEQLDKIISFIEKLINE